MHDARNIDRSEIQYLRSSVAKQVPFCAAAVPCQRKWQTVWVHMSDDAGSAPSAEAGDNAPSPVVDDATGNDSGERLSSPAANVSDDNGSDDNGSDDAATGDGVTEQEDGVNQRDGVDATASVDGGGSDGGDQKEDTRADHGDHSDSDSGSLGDDRDQVMEPVTEQEKKKTETVAPVTDEAGCALAQASPRFFPDEPTVIVGVRPFKRRASRRNRGGTGKQVTFAPQPGPRAGDGGHVLEAGDRVDEAPDLYNVEVEHVEARRVWCCLHSWADFNQLHNQLTNDDDEFLRGKFVKKLPSTWRYAAPPYTASACARGLTWCRGCMALCAAGVVKPHPVTWLWRYRRTCPMHCSV